LTPVGALPADCLSLVLFGPGFGESCVLRVPPDDWIVVDSLQEPDTGANPALSLIRAHGASPKCVVLTHPHEDHAAGLDELLDLQTDGVAGCLPVHVADVHDYDPLVDPDTERAVRRGRAEHAVAAIRNRWDRDSAYEWRMQIRDEQQIVHMTFEGLPHDPAPRPSKRRDLVADVPAEVVALPALRPPVTRHGLPAHRSGEHVPELRRAPRHCPPAIASLAA
jgi:glyoxylase-like metal-dependent hydrolase (beta-lactamase superfamily II)